jgi:ABC-2 type transport system ATP-binding protein
MSFVRVHNLRKSYGDLLAVDDFSLEINAGEIFALVGPDGAGKTTIMRTLCHLILPDQGTLQIGEFDVTRQFDQIKGLLGYMPQTFSLYPDLSIRENLRFYGGVFGVTGERFETQCEQLYKFSNLKPFANRRAQLLSGGMKQKLALSCALIHDPKLLALDEPTTGVDPLSRQQFWEILFKLRKQGVTILVSTPYMDEVAHANRACFIYNGKKLAEGTPEQLVKMFEGQVYYYPQSAEPDVLEKLNRVGGLTVRRFGSGLHFYTPPEVDLASYAAPIVGIGFDLNRFQPIEPDLEDCFIQMMGGESES